jgi:hypothetical protein
MVNLEQVTYCGLYCGLCAQRNRIPARAVALSESMRKEGYQNWGKELPQFAEFWAFLNDLAESESRCSCRGGKCGPPFCSIRTCVPKKGVDACPFCAEYPCDKVLGIARGYVTMLADGKRMKEIGINRWTLEQEKRRKTGFAYADIRVSPYEIPGEPRAVKKTAPTRGKTRKDRRA